MTEYFPSHCVLVQFNRNTPRENQQALEAKLTFSPTKPCAATFWARAIEQVDVILCYILFFPWCVFSSSFFTFTLIRGNNWVVFSMLYLFRFLYKRSSHVKLASGLSLSGGFRCSSPVSLRLIFLSNINKQFDVHFLKKVWLVLAMAKLGTGVCCVISCLLFIYKAPLSNKACQFPIKWNFSKILFTSVIVLNNN